MKKPKKTPQKATQKPAPAQAVSSGEKATGRNAFDDIAVAARKGVGEFLKSDPFKDEKWVKCRSLVATKVVETLPSIVRCLLTGFFAREAGERPTNSDTEKLAIKAISAHGMWDENLGLIIFFAASGHRDFFEHLGKALYEGRKPLYSDAQAFLQVNWDEMRSHWWPHKTDGFKFWRDEAVRSLLSFLYYRKTDGGLDLSAYRSMRDRLKLKPAKQKTIRFCKTTVNHAKKLFEVEVG